MEEQRQGEVMLASLRVLDLTDEKGFFCGRLLGDLGADVIKIEPPGGDPARKIGPFYHNIPDPEKSLFWFAYNANKRGITLDIKTADGRQIFNRLVKTADCIIESFPPGHMDELGLGYSVLCEVNPSIIMTSITPFGQTGPYKDYKDCDLVAMAMGGFMYLTGDPERPPVTIGFPQAYLHAGAEAAIATLIAYYHQQITGEGQWVDVSVEQSVTMFLTQAMPFYVANHVVQQRLGAYRALGSGALSRMVWPCQDGFIMFVIYGGRIGSRTNQALCEWMDSEAMCPDFMKQMDWGNFDLAVVTRETMKRLEEAIGKFFMAHTKAELYQESVKRHMMLAPVSTCDDLIQNVQLRDREFWVQVEHLELGAAITYPGGFVKASETPCQIYRRAPLIGEHNQAIYQAELGISQHDLLILKQAGVI